MTNNQQHKGTQNTDVDKLLGRLRLSHTFNWILAGLVLILAGILIVRGTGQSSVTVESGPSNEGVAIEQPAAADTEADIDSAEQSAQGEASHVRALDGDPLAVGSLDAPVVISEWTDYRCPYCALFAQETLPVLLADYVESGKVRIEFNDVYFFGDDSLDAAVAGRAAAEQGHYLEFIETLYAAAPEKGGHPDMPRETLIQFAKDAGVPDMAKFAADLDSPELLAAVEASHQQAVDWGISSVPFFVVGDQAVAGAQPLEVFTQLIEEAQN